MNRQTARRFPWIVLLLVVLATWAGPASAGTDVIDTINTAGETGHDGAVRDFGPSPAAPIEEPATHGGLSGQSAEGSFSPVVAPSSAKVGDSDDQVGAAGSGRVDPFDIFGQQGCYENVPDFAKPSQNSYLDAYRRWYEAVVINGQSSASASTLVSGLNQAYSSFVTVLRGGSASTGQSTGTGTGTGTGSGTATVTATSTATATGTSTETECPTCTITSTGTDSGTGTGTGQSTGAGTDSGTGTGTGVATNTGTGTGTGVATNTGTGTGTGVATNTGTGTGTGTGSGTGTGTGTGSASGTGTGTGTGTGEETCESIKALMLREYGINVYDGVQEKLLTGHTVSAKIWTLAELQELRSTVAALPDTYRKWTMKIHRNTMLYKPDGTAMPTTLGVTHSWSPFDIRIFDSAYKSVNTTSVGTIVHEMAHAFQGCCPSVMDAWTAQFWPGFTDSGGGTPATPAISTYGNTHPREDMAEAARVYYENGAYLKQTSPTRYEFIKTNLMGGKEYIK